MAGVAEQPVDGSGRNGLAVLYETARWRLEEQLRRIDALDQKLAATFTLHAAVIALFAAAVALRGADIAPAVWGLVVAVVVVFVANIGCAVAAFRLRSWDVSPHLDDLTSVAERFSEAETRAWAAREMTRAYFANEGGLETKAAWLRRAIALAACELTLVAGTAVVAAWPW